MPHLDPTLPTPWPVIERRSLRRLIARVRLHRRRAAPGLRLPASASGDDWPALLARIRAGE